MGQGQSSNNKSIEQVFRPQFLTRTEYVNDDYNTINKQQTDFGGKIQGAKDEVKSLTNKLSNMKASFQNGSKANELNGDVNNIDNLITQYRGQISSLEKQQAGLKQQEKDLLNMKFQDDEADEKLKSEQEKCKRQILQLTDDFNRQFNILQKNLNDVNNRLDTQINNYNILNGKYQNEINLYNQLNAQYNEEIQANVDLQNSLDYLKHHPVKNYDEMYENVKKQNDILKTQIEEKAIDLNVDDQLVFYQSQKVPTFKWINFILYWVYQILIVITLIVLFFFNKTMGTNFKILFVLLFILYPYLIGYLEKLVYFFLSYLYNVFIGEPYSKEERKNPLYANSFT